MKYKLSYAETPFEIKYWKYGCPELLKECIKEYIINMEFITYKIGKKLQDKGYPHGYNRFGYRPIYSDECTIRYLWDTGAYEEEYYGENIPCPTISEVLKWLRVEKKILITIIPQEKNLGHDTLCFAIYRITEDLYQPIYNGTVNTLVDSYEYISLAGIEYVLDNLI